MKENISIRAGPAQFRRAYVASRGWARKLGRENAPESGTCFLSPGRTEPSVGDAFRRNRSAHAIQWRHRPLLAPNRVLANLIGCTLAGQERVVGVVIFPLAIAASQDDIALFQPGTNLLDSLSPGVIVDHVGVRQVALYG